MEYTFVKDPNHKEFLSKVELWSPDQMVHLGPNRIFVPEPVAKTIDRIWNLEVLKTDVWIITPAKCGTTWTQEILWLLKNNCDTERSKKELNLERIPFLEASALLGLGDDTLSCVQKTKEPRVIKSHLSEELLPKGLWEVKPKIVFVYRNPKDAAISFFHHYKLLHHYKGTFDEFFDAYIDELVVFTPFWINVLQFWKRRNEPNVLFITFDQLKKDLRGMVHKIADFLEVKIPEGKEEGLMEAVSFKGMKSNPATNFDHLVKLLDSPYRENLTFIREGKSGGWKDKLTPDQIRRMDEYSMSFLKDTDFPYYE